MSLMQQFMWNIFQKSLTAPVHAQIRNDLHWAKWSVNCVLEARVLPFAILRASDVKDFGSECDLFVRYAELQRCCTFMMLLLYYHAQWSTVGHVGSKNLEGMCGDRQRRGHPLGLSIAAYKSIVLCFVLPAKMKTYFLCCLQYISPGSQA